MRDQRTCIIVIPRTNCDGNNVGKLADWPRNFARLLHPGLGPEHVEEITGNTDEFEVWRLFDQPTEPENTVVEISCKKDFHLRGITVSFASSPGLVCRTARAVAVFPHDR
jgi:hypothetical protein